MTESIENQPAPQTEPLIPTTQPPSADLDVAYSRPWGLTTKTVVAVFTIVLASIVLWRFRMLLQPLIFAVILAYLLLPVIRFVQKRWRWSRGWSVLFVYSIVLLLWISIGFYIGVLAVDQTTRLLNALPNLSESAIQSLYALLQSLAGTTYTLGRFSFTVPDAGQLFEGVALDQQAFQWTQTAVGQGGPLVLDVARGIFTTVGIGFLVLIASIYVARDMPRFGRLISDMAHQPGYRYDADRLMHEFIQIWNAYLRGQVILGLVIGVVVTVALWLLGVRYALALGTLAGLLEFLPVVGPVISTVTAMIVAFFLGSAHFTGLSSFAFAGIVLAVMLVIQQVENGVLVPRIVGGALDLHPLVIIIAVMMGSSLAGILGAILAAPVAASLKLFGAYGWNKMFDLPPFPDAVTGETYPLAATVRPAEVSRASTNFPDEKRSEK